MYMVYVVAIGPCIKEGLMCGNEFWGGLGVNTNIGHSPNFFL